MNKLLLLFFLMLFFINCSYASLFNGTDIHLDEDVCIDETISVENKMIIESTDNNTLTVNSSRGFNIMPSGDLTLIGLTVTGAHDSAIANSGKLTLINCTFISNKGSYGGAIYNDGELTIDNCSFYSNIASVNGGAIYNLAIDCEIKNTVFNSNKATAKSVSVNGGAIYNTGNHLFIDNCIFSDNVIYNNNWYVNGALNGGALFNEANDLVVRSSKFTNNSIYGYLSTGTYHEDLSRKHGGSIYSVGDNNYFISNIISGSEIYTLFPSYDYKKSYGYASYGSAMYLSGNLYLINNTVTDSKAARSAVFISSLYNSSINSNIFRGNYARQGNGIDLYVGQGTNIELIGNDFSVSSFDNNSDPRLGSSWDYAVKLMRSVNITFAFNMFDGCGADMSHYTELSDEELNSNLNITNNVFLNSMVGLKLNAPIEVSVSKNQFINNGVGIDINRGNGESHSRNLEIIDNYFKGNGEYPYASATSVSTSVLENLLIKGNVFEGIDVGSRSVIGISEPLTGVVPDIVGNYFVNNLIGEGGSLIHLETFDDFTNIEGNYFSNNTFDGESSTVISVGGSGVIVSNNIFNDKDGYIFEAGYRYYSWNRVNGENNKIYNYSGDLRDYYDLTDDSVVNLKNTEGYSSEIDLFEDIGNIIDDLISQFNSYIWDGLFNINIFKNPDNQTSGSGEGNGDGSGSGNGNGVGNGTNSDSGNGTSNGSGIGIGSGNGTGVGNGTDAGAGIGNGTGNSTELSNSTDLNNNQTINGNNTSSNDEDIKENHHSNNNTADEPKKEDAGDVKKDYEQKNDYPSDNNGDSESLSNSTILEPVSDSIENITAVTNSSDKLEEIIANITEITNNTDKLEEIITNITDIDSNIGDEVNADVSNNIADTLMSNEASSDSAGFSSVGLDAPSNNLGGDSSTGKSSKSSSSDDSQSETSKETHSYEISKKKPSKQITTKDTLITISIIVIVCLLLFVGFIRKNNE